MIKKVVITGGFGDIALSVKQKLVDLGYAVMNPDRHSLDVTDYSKVFSYFKRIKPNILVNNAGYINPSSILDCSISDWDKHFSININSVFVCSKYAIKNGCSMIINIGSSAGTHGSKNWSAYCCSKRALSAFTECLALEGVSCVSISPGRTDTKMRRMLFPGEDKSLLLLVDEFADAFIEIMGKPLVFNGLDVIIKKEEGVVKKFILMGVKKYV